MIAGLLRRSSVTSAARALYPGAAYPRALHGVSYSWPHHVGEAIAKLQRESRDELLEKDRLRFMHAVRHEVQQQATGGFSEQVEAKLVDAPFWNAVVEPLHELHERPKAESLLILSYAVASPRVAARLINEGTIDRILQLVRGGSSTVQTAACLALGNMLSSNFDSTVDHLLSKGVVEAVTGALGHLASDFAVRIAAASCLGAFGGHVAAQEALLKRGAVAALCEVVKDSACDPNLRATAATALGNAASQEFYDAQEAIAKSSALASMTEIIVGRSASAVDDMLESAVWVLQAAVQGNRANQDTVASKRVVTPLMGLLESKAETVAWHASMALEHCTAGHQGNSLECLSFPQAPDVLLRVASGDAGWDNSAPYHAAATLANVGEFLVHSPSISREDIKKTVARLEGMREEFSDFIEAEPLRVALERWSDAATKK